MLFGPPGVGKSHLAAGLGLKLVENGFRVLYQRTANLFRKLRTARRDLALEAAIRKLHKYHLLIPDDFSLRHARAGGDQRALRARRGPLREPVGSGVRRRALQLLGRDLRQRRHDAGRCRPPRPPLPHLRAQRSELPQAGRLRDLVGRDFSASGPDELWVADITYIPTQAGFLYLAVVLDARSRRIVGWSMATHLRTSLVLGAFEMALMQRQPDGVIHHSDRGGQYTSYAFGGRCREAGVRSSMGAVGNAYDNATCKSFFATLECELIRRRSFSTQQEARLEFFQFIEGWYNPHRRHSSLGYASPVAFEAQALEDAA